MLKKEIRLIYKKKRSELSASERMKMDDLLLIRFQKLDLPFLSLVLSFFPIGEHNEMNTFIIADYLKFRNPALQVAYPKTNLSENLMQAIVCDDEEEFKINQYNIPEPSSCAVVEANAIDLVIVPLLAFDKKGFRVGFGKGYYDRFLKDCRDDCIKIGFSYFEAIDSIDDADEFDVPLDFCITPQKAYVF